MLSKPLSKRRQFEIIWDNMRSYYYTKLSTTTVVDLDHLKSLNRGIDAADSHLQQILAKQQQHVHHVDYEEEEVGAEEMEFVDAIQPHSGPSGFRAQGNRNRNFRTFNPPREPSQSFNTPQEPSNQQPAARQQVFPNSSSSCWNCKQTGHNWRVCREPKSIFCYGCGELGKTIRSCTRCAAAHVTTNPNQNTNAGNY